MKRLLNLFGAVVLFIFGAGITISVLLWTLNTYQFVNRAKIADGVVIKTTHAKSHPRIEYTEASGKKRWFLANDWLSGYRILGYKDGEHLKVFYDPINPARTRIDGFGSLYALQVIIGVFGITILRKGIIVWTDLTVAVDLKLLFWTAVFFTVGCGFLFLIVSNMLSARELISKAKIYDSVVIATPSGGAHPYILYENYLGNKDFFAANGNISNYKVGEHVRVLQDPDDSKRYSIDDFGALYGILFLWFFAFIPLFCGIMLVLFCVVHPEIEPD